MPSPSTDNGSLTLPIGAAKIAASTSGRQLALADPADVAALGGLGVVGVVAGGIGEGEGAGVDLGLSVSAHSASVGQCMTWITCQPNSVLTGSRSWPGLRPGLKIASANAGASWSSVEKYGSLPPVVAAWSSSLSARAIESNCDGSALSFS